MTENLKEKLNSDFLNEVVLTAYLMCEGNVLNDFAICKFKLSIGSGRQWLWRFEYICWAKLKKSEI